MKPREVAAVMKGAELLRDLRERLRHYLSETEHAWLSGAINKALKNASQQAKRRLGSEG